MARGATLPELCSPIPVLIVRCGRWRGRGGGSPNRGTASRTRNFPLNYQRKAQNFGGGLPLKFCTFRCWPSRPIGELADGRGGMALDFQSAADRSDRLRLKIRDHPRTRADVPRRLGGSNSRKDAPPPSGVRSWAGGEGGPIISHNGR